MSATEKTTAAQPTDDQPLQLDKETVADLGADRAEGEVKAGMFFRVPYVDRLVKGGTARC